MTSRADATVRVGSRASALAMTQTGLVIARLRALYPACAFEVVPVSTHGDRTLDRSLTEIGGRGVFVREIEEALLAGEIDLAVHSAKDLPTQQPPGLAIGAFLARVDPRDVLAGRAAPYLMRLPEHARVGTSSRRRAVQLHAMRPDLKLADIRGNVDTRLRKLDEGQYDAIVLAAAGLARLGLLDRATEFFDPSVMLPAPGQGALALERRAADDDIASLIAPLDDSPTTLAVTAERAFLAGLGGGCELPIGAYARVDGDSLELRGMLAGEGQPAPCYADTRGAASDAEALGRALAEQVLRQVGG